MTLEQALNASDYDTATIVDPNGYRVTVAQESKRIRVSAGPDGGFAQMQSDIRTMSDLQEAFPWQVSLASWEAVGEAES